MTIRSWSVRALLRSSYCNAVIPGQHAQQYFSTALAHRHVRLQASKIHQPNSTSRYPTPGDGHDFCMNIFGLLYSTSDIMALQDVVWTNESFLPKRPACALSSRHGDNNDYACLRDLSDIASRMAVKLEDESPGLLAKNELRATVKATLNDEHFCTAMNLLQAFKTEQDPLIKAELGHMISNLAFWSQWLLRGVLFEGKLHWQQYCEAVIRAPLSKIAFAANAALGRHQIEFVYDDYTLKAAVFPSNVDLDVDVDYDDAKSIVDAVVSIATPVGFNSVKGGSPEHNFRHVHSLMEWQMKRAFRGGHKIMAGQVDEGWQDVVEAARRANRVFQTMLRNT